MNPSAPQPRHARLTSIAGLLLLSLLWALGSLRPDFLPNLPLPALPPFAAQSLPLALLAVTASLFALARRTPWPRAGQILSAFWIALGLFVAPAWLVHLAQNSASGFTRVALFSLIPVFTVVFEPHIDPCAAPHTARFSLAAALASVLGFLIVFPLDLPSSPQSAAAFFAILFAAAAIAAAGCLAVRAARHLTPGSLASFAALTCIIAAVCLILSSALTGNPLTRWPPLAPKLLWSALVDLPALALLFWLFRRLSAARIATRFLFSPLFAALASALILLPHIHLFTAAGLFFISGGAAWLLLAPAEPPDTGPSPLHLRCHGKPRI